mgnify:CR=1 FL=1
MQNVPKPPREASSSDGKPSSKPSRWVANQDGFGIHAGTQVPSKNRVFLEILCRYGMRPAFSKDSISLSDDGKVIVKLKKPWPRPGGTTLLVMEPEEFLRRLCPLIPPPFAHLIRYHGLFAPHAKDRNFLPAAPPLHPEAPPEVSQIRPEVALRVELAKRAKQKQTTSPSVKPDPNPSDDASSVAPENNDLPITLPHDAIPSNDTVPGSESDLENPEESTTPIRPKRSILSWAALLKRVFGFDVLICPNCGGTLSVIAFIIEATVAVKILTHLNLPTTSPPVSPARRLDLEQLNFEEEWNTKDAEMFVDRLLQKTTNRGPPDKSPDDWVYEMDEDERHDHSLN